MVSPILYCYSEAMKPCFKKSKSLPKLHGLYTIYNYIDTKEESSKKLTCKGTLRQVFIRVIVYRLENLRYSQSCWYLRPSFLNCCPSNLLSGSTLPPLPFPCVNKYTVVYTRIQCVGGGGGGYRFLGLRQIITCLYRSIFLYDDILHYLLWFLWFLSF